MLDLGSGNGAVAALAVEISAASGLGLEAHGVDAADIAPERHAGRSRPALCEVVFQPRTAIEALPFAADHFAAACGQYAIENAEREAAVGEIVRVVQPAGALRFLLHTADSVLIGRSAVQQAQVEALFASGLFAHMHEATAAVFAVEQEGIRSPDAAKPAQTAHQRLGETLRAAEDSVYACS